MKTLLKTFHEKKEEFSSAILAIGYLCCKGIVALTMDGVYRLFGLRKEVITLWHAEVYLVATTLLFIALIFGAQFWLPLGWAIIVLGNLRIFQIVSLNLLTLLFNFTPTGGSDAALKRARWHFLALGFSLLDVLLIYAFMYQFFDTRMGILNKHFTHFLEYFYYSLVTMSTVGYGDVYPVTLFGKCLACYEIFMFLFMIVFFVSGISGRFERHTG